MTGPKTALSPLLQPVRREKREIMASSSTRSTYDEHAPKRQYRKFNEQLTDIRVKSN